MAALDEFLTRVTDCASSCHITESSWDAKGNCVVQLMNSALAEDALVQLQEIFPHLWSRRDADELPSDIARIVQRFGGFRDGQFVAASQPMDGVLAWAWWAPWADDVTVSLRVGLLGDVTEAQQRALRAALVNNAP